MGSESSRARAARLARTFDRSAAVYERGRPGYPAAAIRFLARTFRLGRGSTIVELGSGTGKFTRALRPIGAAVVAVEPMPGMRREFERRVPEVPVLAGTAESIPLPDGFADAVFAAQAFHWFRGNVALREIARVLRPEGGLGLVWNERDDRVRWSREFSRILVRHGGPRPYHDDEWRAAFRQPNAPFRVPRRRSFPHHQRAPASTFVDRALSVSIVQAQPASVRREVVAEVRALLATDPATRGRPTIVLPYRTEVFFTRRRGPGARRRT